MNKNGLKTLVLTVCTIIEKDTQIMMIFQQIKIEKKDRTFLRLIFEQLFLKWTFLTDKNRENASRIEEFFYMRESFKAMQLPISNGPFSSLSIKTFDHFPNESEARNQQFSPKFLKFVDYSTLRVLKGFLKVSASNIEMAVKQEKLCFHFRIICRSLYFIFFT